MKKAPRNIRNAIAKYGRATCLKAFVLNSRDGEGPHTVSIYCGPPNVSAANAAITAGRYMNDAPECERCTGTGTIVLRGFDTMAEFGDCPDCIV